MEIELLKKISNFPFIWDNIHFNGKRLPQNKHCLNCRSLDCKHLLASQNTEYRCMLGFDSFSFNLREGKAIFNGLITDDNKVIKKGRLEARKEYVILRSDIERYLMDLHEISTLIDEGIKGSIKDSFTLFHDVRSSYAIAFSNLESIILNQAGSTFYDKLQSCDQKLIDLYDSLDLVNSQLGLIDVMVNPAAIVQGSKKELNLYKLTHKLSKLFAVKAQKKNLSFEMQSVNTIPSKLFHDSIKLIPMILLENAIKYSEPDNRIIIMFEYLLDKIKFYVSTYGIPVPEQDRERIFEKQQRGSNSRKYTNEGIGMGLYIAKKILHEHNGTVSTPFSKLDLNWVSNIVI